MKAVMLSIKPKWCELIASGKKTIEVCKTKPKLETPFKCYIYCTKGRELLISINGVVQKIDEWVFDLNHKGDQPWVFFGRNDAKAETPVLWYILITHIGFKTLP